MVQTCKTDCPPKGQIDFGKGTITCPRCGGVNYRGAAMCGHLGCTASLPFEKTKSSYDNNGGSLDISKYSPNDIEHAVAAGDGFKVKQKGFEKYVDEVKQLIRTAPSEQRRAQLVDVLNRQAIPYYNKYHSTNYKG